MVRRNGSVRVRRSLAERVFSVANVAFLILVAAICLFPFLHETARSFSAESAIVGGQVTIFPVGFHTEAYKTIFENVGMRSALRFTIILTVLGTVVNLIVTTFGAYPLSKRQLVGRRAIWLFILFTMFFNGGLIPTFLIVRSVGLLDRIWALILPVAVNTFNLIIMMTFFRGIPDSLEESARMDGCSDFGVLIRIVLPLSLPVLATMTLFYSVGHWNQFFLALIYINDTSKFTLQLKLRQLVIQDNIQAAMEGSAFVQAIPRESIKAAAVMYATVPILIVYPWLQKYFVKGALLGSLKG
jgi:putative aldouronate transport system permease protein